MNNDKTYVYDERPEFMSYNAASFPYMGMPMMPVAMGNNANTCQNNSNLENRIASLENRVSKLESNMYPKAIDTNNGYTYQSSLNIM